MIRTTPFALALALVACTPADPDDPKPGEPGPTSDTVVGTDPTAGPTSPTTPTEPAEWTTVELPGCTLDTGGNHVHLPDGTHVVPCSPLWQIDGQTITPLSFEPDVEVMTADHDGTLVIAVNKLTGDPLAYEGPPDDPTPIVPATGAGDEFSAIAVHDGAVLLTTSSITGSTLLRPRLGADFVDADSAFGTVAAAVGDRFLTAIGDTLKVSDPLTGAVPGWVSVYPSGVDGIQDLAGLDDGTAIMIGSTGGGGFTVGRSDVVDDPDSWTYDALDGRYMFELVTDGQTIAMVLDTSAAMDGSAYVARVSTDGGATWVDHALPKAPSSVDVANGELSVVFWYPDADPQLWTRPL